MLVSIKPSSSATLLPLPPLSQNWYYHFSLFRPCGPCDEAESRPCICCCLCTCDWLAFWLPGFDLRFPCVLIYIVCLGTLVPIGTSEVRCRSCSILCWCSDLCWFIHFWFTGSVLHLLADLISYNIVVPVAGIILVLNYFGIKLDPWFLACCLLYYLLSVGPYVCAIMLIWFLPVCLLLDLMLTLDAPCACDFVLGTGLFELIGLWPLYRLCLVYLLLFCWLLMPLWSPCCLVMFLSPCYTSTSEVGESCCCCCLAVVCWMLGYLNLLC
jgi:hypothetical protein